MWKKFKRLAGSLGPGLITAAVVLGPGSITLLSRSGATLGYRLVWVPIAAGILMATFVTMAARVGTVSDVSLLTLVKRQYGRWLSVLMGVASFLVCCSFQAGDNMGVSASIYYVFEESLPGPQSAWIKGISIAFTLVCIGVVLGAPNLYKVLERMMTILVLVMVLCFFANLFPSRPSLSGIARGLVPSAGSSDMKLLVPIVATTFSVIAALYQAYIVQGKGWKLADLRTGCVDSVVGIGVLAMLSVVILITAAAVLQPHNVQVKTAGEMARQLEPLLGPAAKFLFAIGLWGASFSSQMANPIIGGGLLADGLGLGSRFESRAVKVCTVVAMVIGAVVVQFFAGHMLDLIVFAQRITIVIVPLCAIVMMLLANNRAIMGEHRNGLKLNLLGTLGVATVVGLAGFEVWKIVAR